MNLPIVNVFSKSYEIWNKRKASQQEILDNYRVHGYFADTVNDQLRETISTFFDAAYYMARIGVDNALGSHIDDQLDSCLNYKSWRQAMPSRTPAALAKYQKNYPTFDVGAVNHEINNIGALLSEEQCLFHGGFWGFNKSSVTLSTPFSTSFCPQVALRNAEWSGKAFDAGEVHIFVLRASRPRTNVFVYRRKGTKHGNENEVLFASGAHLTLIKRHFVSSDYSVSKFDKYGLTTKKVPIYVLEISIS